MDGSELDLVSDPSVSCREDSSKKPWGLRSCETGSAERPNRSKQVKMRDLESVIQSEGLRTSNLEGSMNPMPVEQQSENKEASKIEEETSSMLSARLDQVTAGRSSLSLEQDTACLSLCLDRAEHNKDRANNPQIMSSMDLSGTVEHNPFHPYKKLGQAGPADASESGSTTGPLEESEALRKWKKMKQNGFLSLSHGGIPLPKKQREPRQPRKRREPEPKKKTELPPKPPRRQQASMFTRLAAPSGLLSGLDLGIIKHVRNSKQVHSIIEAIVRSHKHDAQSQNIAGGQLGSEGHNQASECDNNTPAFKLPSAVTTGSNNASSSSGENISSLSLKAATVASEWLELLQLDIKDRLAALRRSKKRVRNVIDTELPYLLSTELSSNQENDPCSGHSSDSKCHVPDVHVARWRSLFSQMDKALSEEEKHLESWLRDVHDMHLHCQQGLRYIAAYPLSLIGSSEGSRSKNSNNAESAVKAAAASIYAICNLVMSREKKPST